MDKMDSNSENLKYIFHLLEKLVYRNAIAAAQRCYMKLFWNRGGTSGLVESRR